MGGAGCDATTDNILDAVIPPPQYIINRIQDLINGKQNAEGFEL